MFIVEILVGDEWRAASSHSKEVDAEAQKARYLDQGEVNFKDVGQPPVTAPVTEDSIRIRNDEPEPAEDEGDAAPAE